MCSAASRIETASSAVCSKVSVLPSFHAASKRSSSRQTRVASKRRLKSPRSMGQRGWAASIQGVTCPQQPGGHFTVT